MGHRLLGYPTDILEPKKLTYDKKFSCDLCEYKCHANTLLRVHYKQIHGGDIPKRPKLHAVRIPGTARIPLQLQRENFEIGEVSSQIEENVKSEKHEDELEEIVPFEETSVSNSVETESAIPKKEKPKFSLKGLLNKSNVKIVTSIKVFKCDICKQEWVDYLCYKNLHLILLVCKAKVN